MKKQYKKSRFLCLCFLLLAQVPIAVSAQQIAQSGTTVNAAQYNQKISKLANGAKYGRWPVQTPLPLQGAILPFKRVVAFYGNLYSTRMGILGELPKAAMLKKLQQECGEWQKADTATPVVPALHYIAVTAQASPGKDGMYRLRMPAAEIEKIIAWAGEINALVFLDIQTGHSSVAKELPPLEKYLKLPQVHLGIDPEYSMKNGGVPCTSIGTFDAEDVNDAISYLTKLVSQYQLPPKMLVVHRFTQNMLTNYKQAKPTAAVQVVVNMDGFGSKTLKLSSYNAFIAKEPVQFAGFKLFYKIDKPKMYQPSELMQLKPIPIYIQYQ